LLGGESTLEEEVDLQKGTLFLKVGQEIDDPFERLLIAIDPIELHFLNPEKEHNEMIPR